MRENGRRINGLQTIKVKQGRNDPRPFPIMHPAN
jgi:hypothetical protein